MAIDLDGASNDELRAEIARLTAVVQALGSLYDLTTDLVGVAGFDGFFRSVNPAWTAALGWTAAEITAKPWLDFVHPTTSRPRLAQPSS